MSKSLLNRQNVKQELSKGAGIQTVSKEAIDWVDAVTRELVLKLAKYGWRTPGGRLKAPKLDPEIMARCFERESAQPANPLRAQEIPVEPVPEEWSDYNDWQQAVRTGATKLSYEEWKKQNGKEENA